MIKDEISLLPIKGSFIKRISYISHICKLNFWTDEDYLSELKRDDSFNVAGILTFSNQLIGFMFARLIIPSITISLHNEKHNEKMLFREAEILTIGVSPKYQKQGIGQILFDYFRSFCIKNKIENVWLEVRKSNKQALRFYYKNGFRLIYQRQNYYQNPVEDALVLKLNLAFNELC